MQNETYVTEHGIENRARLEELIEKGNQLHNRAIFDFFTGLVSKAGLLKRRLSGKHPKSVADRRGRLSFQHTR